MDNKLQTNMEKNISDNVLNRVKALETEGNLQFPENYSYTNALKSAWLQLQTANTRDNKPVLQACTQTSIANALLDMVVQGLSPLKKQCYFIAYGNQLQLSRSYLGTIAATKRLKGVKDVRANIIYEGDTFEYEINVDTGLKKILKHEQHFENIDITKIKGAYAIVIKDDGDNYVEIMNMNQIRLAWNQGPMKGNSGAHKNFTDEMAKKTVINRACKMYVNTSDDSDIIVGAFHNGNGVESYSDDEVVENVNYEISQNANTIPIEVEVEEPMPIVDDEGNYEGQMNMMGPEF